MASAGTRQESEHYHHCWAEVVASAQVIDQHAMDVLLTESVTSGLCFHDILLILQSICCCTHYILPCEYVVNTTITDWWALSHLDQRRAAGIGFCPPWCADARGFYSEYDV